MRIRLRRIPVFLAAGVVAILLALPALAQSRTSSALTGRIVDESGAPLPGATVKIESPAMIGGLRASSTDKDGHFRFVEIPPGVYTITISMEGYKTLVREDVRLSVGLTTEVPVKLTQYAGQETVTVKGEAPVIDPTSSATVTTLPKEYLYNMPTSHFQPDTLNLAPGINLDSAYGGGEGSGNSYEIDGIDTSDPEANTAWSFFDYNIIEEVELVGLGAPAEYGGFTGVVFNSITKSGSNQFRGFAEATYTNDSLTSSNSDIPNINPTTKRFIDSTVQAGGPLLKDKVWYFASAEYLADDSTNGGPISTERDPRLFAKLSWQVTPNNNFEGSLEWDRYDITGRGADAFTPLEATVTEKAPEVVWNLNWKSVLSPNTTFKFTYGGWTGYYYLDPVNGYGTAGHLDANTGTYSRNSYYYYKADRSRDQANTSITYHANNFIKGDHDFKFGMEIERSTLRSRYGYPTGSWFYDNYGTAVDPSNGQPETYSLVYSNYSYDVHAKNRRLSVFAQDSWRITPTLTINPGVRLDMNRGYVSGGRLVFNTNPVAGRLGIAWDLTSDGKTILKSHYGRYYEALFSTFYYWVDPDAFHGLREYRFFPTTGTLDPTIVGQSPDGRYAIDPDIKHPYLDQFLLGLDREIAPGLSLSGTLVYRKNKDFIETVSRDGVFVPVRGFVPKLGGDPGNPQPSSQKVTLFDYLNPQTDTLLVSNPSGLERTYKALMLVATKRLSKNWQLLASYVYSKATGNEDNTLGFSAIGGNSPGSFLDTPNSLVNAQGRLTHDQTHQVKLQGQYVIPKIGLSFSGNYVLFSGDTWTPRTTCLLTDDGNGVIGDGILGCHNFPQGVVRYFQESRGSERLPSRSTLDLRAQWFHVFKAGKFGVMADVFNVFNQGRPTLVQDRSDVSSYGEPKTWSDPRNVRLGVRFEW